MLMMTGDEGGDEVHDGRWRGSPGCQVASVVRIVMTVMTSKKIGDDED